MIGEKVSVITISFNSISTIEETFQSVLKQAYRPLEYVLVDGGSIDGTRELIEQYIPLFEAKSVSVNYVSEKDNGISDAFNKGIKRTTGEIIGIINSDDRLADGALEKIARSFSKSTAGVVCGDCLWIDKKNNTEYVRKSKMNLKRLKYDMVLMHPTCFVKKTVYEKYGIFDTSLKYAMDKDLMARFYQNGVRFEYIPEIIAEMSAGGASDVNADKVFNEGIEIAVRNGVPRPFAKIRFAYKAIRLKFISIIKLILKQIRNVKGSVK